MNWSKILGNREVLTGAERSKLEDLDRRASAHRVALEKIRAEVPNHYETRNIRIREAGQTFADDPCSENFDKYIRQAQFSVNALRVGLEFQQVEGQVLNAIDRILQPGNEIIRAVFRRELGRVETELLASNKIGRKRAQDLGVEYTCDSVTRALEERVLELRNTCASERYEHWLISLKDIL